jgi:DNA-binding CsgD family transcriptional regulator
LIQGLTNKEIAGRMNISPNTVRAFIRMVMGKLGVSTRSGIVGIVFRGIYTAINHRP